MKTKRFLAKVLFIAMVLCMLFSTIASATTIILTIDSSVAVIDNKEITMDVAPEVTMVNGGGVTFVPVRFITEKLGLVNKWSASAPNDVVLSGTEFEGKIVIGSTAATINGEAKTLLAAPYINSGRTMVPLRFLSQNIGYNVVYDVATQTITITDSSYIQVNNQSSSQESSTQTSGNEQSTEEIAGSQNYHGHVYTGGSYSKKYHYEAECAGKLSHEITWEDVKRKGLTPCSTCVLQ